METKLLTTKVKVKSCALILYLSCQQYFLKTNASIKKSDVAKYFIERRPGSTEDIFSVLFKQGCDQNPTCAELSAYDHASRENFTRTCICKYESRTFLPEKGKCLSDNQTANSLKGPQTLSAMGCAMNVLSWDELFLNGFNLTTSDTGNDYLPEKFQSCEVIPRSPVYYDSLDGRWKSIFSEIFTVRFNETHGIILEWKADINNTLSGRILRLNVTCNYTETNKLPLNGCLLIKAVGAVTYNYENQDSECPSSTISSLVPTVSPLSTSVVSILPSSLPVSSILPSLSYSSLSSPSSVLTTIITTTAQVSLKTPTASLASVKSQNSLADSSFVLPSAPETRHTVSFSSSEVLQNTVVSKTIVKPAIKTYALSVNPSKPSLTTKAASSSAVIDRPGNKKARVNGNDNGVVIGAVVGGAGVCIIIIIIVIVFCKRRNLWLDFHQSLES